MVFVIKKMMLQTTNTNPLFSINIQYNFPKRKLFSYKKTAQTIARFKIVSYKVNYYQISSATSYRVL